MINQKIYILRGERKVRYHERILSNKGNLKKKQFHFHLFELEILIELEHLPEHLIGVLFEGNTMT